MAVTTAWKGGRWVAVIGTCDGYEENEGGPGGNGRNYVGEAWNIEAWRSGVRGCPRALEIGERRLGVGLGDAPTAGMIDGIFWRDAEQVPV